MLRRMGNPEESFGEKLKFEPQGWNLSLKARVWATRMGFGPQGCNLCLEDDMWALRPGFEPQEGG